jgi:hypothetical protein
MSKIRRIEHKGQRQLMGGVRALQPRDLASVARLYESVLERKGLEGSRDFLRKLRHVLIGHPWRDMRLSSFVFENEEGIITGCLGVLPRRMYLNGKEICVAISHSFIVEPESRPTLAALQLARAFLTGPQELSLAEGNEISRRIWEGIGGYTSPVRSLYWTKPLRAGSYVASVMKRRGLSPLMEAVLRPPCWLVDRLNRLIPGSGDRVDRASVEGVELNSRSLVDAFHKVSRESDLTPQYDVRTISWILDTIEAASPGAPIRKVLVKKGDESVGWYLYRMRADRTAEVIQLYGRHTSLSTVFWHLLCTAYDDGAVAVSGRSDPNAAKAFGKSGCIFHHDGDSWFLAHSRSQAVMDSLYRDKAFLTRLEGEWWISSYLG